MRRGCLPGCRAFRKSGRLSETAPVRHSERFFVKDQVSSEHSDRREAGIPRL